MTYNSGPYNAPGGVYNQSGLGALVVRAVARSLALVARARATLVAAIARGGS